MGDFTAVGSVDEFVPGRIREFEVNGRALCGVRVGDRVYAFDRYCTHEYVELTYGYVLEGRVHCAQHGAAYNLETGYAESGPADADLHVYEVKVEGGQVMVQEP